MPNNKQPHVSIIILNWNSWRDTIECLESVFKLDYPNFNIILVDNHSTNYSVEKIVCWAKGELTEQINSKFEKIITPEIAKPVSFITIPINYEQDRPVPQFSKEKLIFLLNDKNMGFAVANNQAIKFARTLFKSDYYFLLNNDTVIDSHALDMLVSEMEKFPDVGAAQSVIYHYVFPTKIANAGGKIFPWGQTKYYTALPSSSSAEVTFVNGCALCIRREIIEKHGLLSEQFFFAEEDFEFSLRLLRAHVKKICVANSKVYHKVGISSAEYLNKKIEKKVMLFALNRIVDMKNFYSEWVWRVWRPPVLFYFLCLLILKYRVNLVKSINYIQKIKHLTTRLESVDRVTVEKVLGILT